MGRLTGGSRLRRVDERGVTLPELMLALAISGMILLGVLAVWQQAQQSYFQGSEAAELQGNVRVALDQIAREVRRTGHDPTSAAFAPIGSATGQRLEVRMDLNSDGDTADADEDVTFALDTAQKRLTRDGGAGATALAEQIIANPDGTPVFQYWQRPLTGGQCGPGALVLSATPTIACIRRVTITLTGQSLVAGQSVTHTVRTDVDLRAR